MTKISVGVKVTGLVHGVFFRATLARVATDEGIAGWVKNLPDGSVEAMFEGEEPNVARVIEWARHGPPRARVDSVKVEQLQVRNLRGFRIEG